MGNTAFILLNLYTLSWRFWVDAGLRASRSIRLRQAETSRSLGRQGDVVVTFSGVTYQETFLLFQIFHGPDEVRICKGRSCY